MPVNSDKRKHAIRLLNGPPPAAKATGPRRRRRGQTYGSRLVSILKAVWEAADYPWSVRLQALLPEWMPWIRHRFRFKAEIEQQLLQTSPRSIDRRLREEKRKVRRRIYGRTKSGTLLKHHIPVKTDHDERSLSEPDAPVSEPLPALGEAKPPYTTPLDSTTAVIVRFCIGLDSTRPFEISDDAWFRAALPATSL